MSEEKREEKSLIDKLVDSRQELREELNSLVEKAESEKRELNEEEVAEFEAKSAKIKDKDSLIDEMRSMAARDEEVAESRKSMALSSDDLTPAVEVVSEPVTYSKEGRNSFLKDAFAAKVNGDYAAQERIVRHQKETQETRDIGTDAFAGLVVPQYLTELVAEKARAGSPFYNAVPKSTLPAEGMKVELSRITTGTAAAFQASQNAAVQETNMDDTLLTVNVDTIAGQQDVSRQAIERGTNTEEIIVKDLVSAYYTTLDDKMLNGAGSSGVPLGLANVSGTNSVTYTDASPTVAELYPKLIDAIQQINTNRFMAGDAIIMHPRRWAFMTAAVDSSNRPLVLPIGNAPQNAMGVGDAAKYGQVVGTIAGLPVITDANIATNLGTGTNEDQIFVVKSDDHILFEEAGSPFKLRFDDVGSGSLTVKLVVYGYVAYASGRYPGGISKIGGTGLVTPTF